MTNQPAPAARPQIKLERTYEASVEDLWFLWTTKEGLESWWGPEGFRIEVRELDLRVGGTLFYDMIADAPEQIEYMKQAGFPISHETRSIFTEIVPNKRLAVRSIIDFLPGVEPYETNAVVEFSPSGKSVRMVITLDKMHSDEWTKLATMGWESQLTKLPAALAARR
jgi:uncharacterized protein YndB with AHSA1/START domain